jgi:hypothetical protein
MEPDPMMIRISLIPALAALLLGTAACTQGETQRAEAEAAEAGNRAEAAAARAGEVVESGAMKAAQAVETGAGNVADRLEAEQAKAAAEGRPGAIDPATGERLPAD